MFLCSRDIQVGDKVQCFVEGEWKYCDLFHPEEVEEWEKEGAFKVIGEISPDALSYVREGQEFEEGDIQLMFFKGSHAGISGSTERIKELSALADNTELRARVKGPCNHFH
jgi:hypothetical protein